ncbi:MAG: hypothetical protein KAH01_02175 [Caldisericia bacterium]|nr:hypothetical protein [Caldisericia bacterium]
MNNGIEIDITITMGDTCSNTMSLDDARALHESLTDLFFTTGSKKSSTKKVESKTPTVSPGMIKQPKPVNPGYDADTPLPPPNLKVEAARIRAAERTKGCGSKNK